MNRRGFLTATAVAPLSTATAGCDIDALTDHELAALLDPRAYVWQAGPSWSLTVPTGEVWFALNAWGITLSAAKWYHRELCITQAVALPAGMTLSTDLEHGFLYYCRPSLVSYADPAAVYASRIDRLHDLPMYTVAVHIPAGTPAGAPTFSVLFPADFEHGLLRHVSAHDVSWVGLAGADPTNPNVRQVVNTINEIDDHRRQRETRRVYAPFRRYQGGIEPGWTGVRAGIGNGSGDPNRPTDMHGWGMAWFNKLPGDW